MFADANNPRGISLEKLVDYICNVYTTPITSTTDTDWGMIRKDETLYNDLLYQLDSAMDPHPLTIQAQLYEKLDKQLEQNLTLHVRNASNAITDTVDTVDVEEFIRQTLTESGKNILGNAASRAGILTTENSTQATEITSLKQKDSAIDTLLGELDARITSLEEKVVV